MATVVDGDLLDGEDVCDLSIELVLDAGRETPAEAALNAVTPDVVCVEVIEICVSVLCHRIWTLYAFIPSPGITEWPVVFVLPPLSIRALIIPDEVKTLVHGSVVCQRLSVRSQPQR
jgi:hypothetical protein